MTKNKKEPKNRKKLIIRILLFIIIAVLFFLYGSFIATSGLIVKEYKIVNSNLPDSYHGLKIVHISDIHYGRSVQKQELTNMVNKINMIKPDIVVLTGDLFDKDIKLDKSQLEELQTSLQNIKTTIGKYAVKGNHDFKFDEWVEVINKSNFLDLNDNYDLIYNDSYEYILINGMSTNLHGKKSIADKIKPVNDYIENLKIDKVNQEKQSTKPKYKIMIMHEPDYIDKFDYNKYDLILAGHSHNGQVRIPSVGAIILPKGAKKYYKEHYQLKNTELFISSGTGTSTFKFRLFNRPSINLYRLTNK